ncbi:MAG TPA: cytochrome c [Candidatus Dormibacteraeota bacterium]|nr:cytochrome c [Candidatus Dormibacteraeota bacterium]
MRKSTMPPSIGFLERAALRHPMRAHILALLALILIAAIVAIAFAALIFVRPSSAAEPNKPAIAKQAQNPAAASAERGKKLFTSDGCYECHGRAAQGGVGPRLGPDPLPLSFIEKYVRHPSGQMPPYTAKTVSDQNLADIYAFLKSLPESPKSKDIPLLNQ